MGRSGQCAAFSNGRGSSKPPALAESLSLPQRMRVQPRQRSSSIPFLSGSERDRAGNSWAAGNQRLREFEVENLGVREGPSRYLSDPCFSFRTRERDGDSGNRRKSLRELAKNAKRRAISRAAFGVNPWGAKFRSPSESSPRGTLFELVGDVRARETGPTDNAAMGWGQNGGGVARLFDSFLGPEGDSKKPRAPGNTIEKVRYRSDGVETSCSGSSYGAPEVRRVCG
jgi:hypothetical protein